MAPKLPPRPTFGHPLYHYVVTEPHALAVYDYEPSQADELSFKAGEVVMLNKWINSDWLSGRTTKASGMFPASFVDVIIHPTDNDNISHKPSSPGEQVSNPSASHQISTGPRCSARFDYEAEEPGDLGFVAGDVIQLIERSGDEWLKGELDGRVGMFPVSFVEIIEDLPMSSAAIFSSESLSVDSKMSTIGNKVTALFDFQGRYGELFFQAGTVLTVLSEVDSDWLYGEANGYRGRFPRECIDRVPAGLPQFTDDKKQAVTEQLTSRDDGLPYCIAMYDYTGETSSDLSFVAGDRITLTSHEGSDWLKGTLNGRPGIFPVGYVNIVRDIDGIPPRPHVAYNSHPEPTSYMARPGPESPSASTAAANAMAILGGYSSVEHDSTSASHGDFQTSSSAGVGSALALFDFPGGSPEDLVFHEGDTIQITEILSSDWMRGKINDQVGMFPTAYVQVIVPVKE